VDFGVDIPNFDKPTPLKYDGDAYLIEQWKNVVLSLMKNTPTKEIVLAIAKQPKFHDAISKVRNISAYLESVRKIINEPWFYGFMARDVAHGFLSEEEVGTFLFRCSDTKPFSFAMEYRSDDKNITAMLIRSQADGFILDQEHHVYQESFKNLSDVIESWKIRLRIPFKSDVPSTLGFYGTLDSDKAQQLLTGGAKGTYIVRFSSQPHAYAVSYVSDKGDIAKSMIIYENKQYYLKGTNDKRSTIQEILKLHSNVFVKPHIMK